MRIAHLSDLHLGARVHPRTEGGWNLRERDVASAFQNALLAVIRLAPDLVVLSGDLFDEPDPPSTAFLSLVRGVHTLREGLPGVPVLAIAGGHDTPAPEAEPGPVAVLDALPGVEAAAASPRSVHLEALDLHALLVPHRAGRASPLPELRPDPAARWNLLVLRGVPAAAGPCLPEALAIDPGPWDAVLVGGAHQADTPAPGVSVAGALERVGPDPWAEQSDETGFVLLDLARGTRDFHPLPGRPVVDLAPVVVDPADPAPGTRRLRDLLEGLPGGIDGKLLRVRLQGDILVPEEAIAPGLLQAIRARTAHVEFVIRDTPDPPEAPSPPPQPPPAPLALAWSRHGHPQGTLSLRPGVWALTADADPHRIELADALARLRGGTGPAAPIDPAAGRGDPLPGAFGFRWVEGRPDPDAAGEPPSAPEPEAPEEAPHEPTGADGEEGADRAAVRGAWVERAGELEARSLEWVRDRQAAESRLESCRDRAHELRARIRHLKARGPEAECPTCRRPLAEAHPGLMATLEEEWEAVVQDGTWWRRRREQLEDKPADLRALEREVLALQARLQEPGDGGVRRRAEGDGGPGVASGNRDVLRQAGGLLHRATGGRLSGLVPGGEGEDEVAVLPAGGEAGRAAPGDRTLVEAALAVAAWWEAGDGRAPLLVLPSPHGGGEAREADAARFLELVAALVGEGAGVVLTVVSPRQAGRVSDALAGILEARPGASGGVRFRVHPGGPPRLVWDVPG